MCLQQTKTLSQGDFFRFHFLLVSFSFVLFVVVVEFGVCAVVGISKFKFLKQICENVGSVFVYRLTISIDEKKIMIV